MRFHGAVLFHGDDVDDLLVVAEEIMVEKERRPVPVRCSCTWTAAAEHAGRAWRAGSAPLFAQAERPGILKSARRKRLLGIARRVNELWQERTRTMVDHPTYGRAAPDCPDCRGAGRVSAVEYAKFDSYGEILTGQWAGTLTRPCRVPRVWPWPDDLWFRFNRLCTDAGVPPFDLDEVLAPGLLGTIAPGGLDENRGVVPVRRLLDLDAVPDTVALVDPAGRWLEREEVETAEDLASWHGRLTSALREHPRAGAALVEFHA